MKTTITLYKYHIFTANEDQVENLEQDIQFAVFPKPIENEMLFAAEWLYPIGKREGVLIKDIIQIDFLGKQEVFMESELGKFTDKKEV